MDVLRNVPFTVGTTRDAEGMVCVKLAFHDVGLDVPFVFDRDPAVALIEALRVALEILEANSPESQN
jgi:hypothetical protein